MLISLYKKMVSFNHLSSELIYRLGQREIEMHIGWDVRFTVFLGGNREDMKYDDIPFMGSINLYK